MKLTIILVLFGCVAVIKSQDDCQYTPCVGLLYNGQVACQQYGLGYYTGRTKKDNCGWDTSKGECCKAIPRPGCKWTAGCYGSIRHHTSECYREYGGDWMKPGRKMRCSMNQYKKFECCQ